MSFPSVSMTYALRYVLYVQGGEQAAKQANSSAHASEKQAQTSQSCGQQDEPREELWEKRLYFVRMPKFPEVNQLASEALQEELDMYRSQCQLLNDSINITRVRANNLPTLRI